MSENIEMIVAETDTVKVKEESSKYKIKEDDMITIVIPKIEGGYKLINTDPILNIPTMRKFFNEIFLTITGYILFNQLNIKNPFYTNVLYDYKNDNFLYTEELLVSFITNEVCHIYKTDLEFKNYTGEQPQDIPTCLMNNRSHMLVDKQYKCLCIINTNMNIIYIPSISFCADDAETFILTDAICQFINNFYKKTMSINTPRTLKELNIVRETYPPSLYPVVEKRIQNMNETYKKSIITLKEEYDKRLQKVLTSKLAIIDDRLLELGKLGFSYNKEKKLFYMYDVCIKIYEFYYTKLKGIYRKKNGTHIAVITAIEAVHGAKAKSDTLRVAGYHPNVPPYNDKPIDTLRSESDDVVTKELRPLTGMCTGSLEGKTIDVDFMFEFYKILLEPDIHVLRFEYKSDDDAKTYLEEVPNKHAWKVGGVW